MKLRLLLPLLLAVPLIAGCGSGGSSAKLDSGDIAVVGSQHVTLAMYNQALSEERASLKAQGQPFPKAGTDNYAALKTAIIGLLTQQAEFAEQAAKLGVHVTNKNLESQLVKFKKKYFGGSEKAYRASLKQQGFTDTEVRSQIKEQLLENKLFQSVTKTTNVSNSDIKAYYQLNITTYQQPASRDVQEILVGKNKQQLAQQIYSKLKGGASFVALAKQYSQDPGSKNIGGKFTAKQGSDVPEFDKAVFATTSKTGALLQPVKTAQYGWFVIQPTGAIKPGKTTSESKAAPTIRKQLNSTKKNQVMSDWVTGIAKTYCSGKIAYSAAYEPSPDPCTAITTTAATTT